ncbi:hypothetical protein MASR2M47_34530 [Draconibacterium sp.]|jgi:hypothetical protein
METKDKSKEKTPFRTEGGFDAVKFMREQRDRITKDIMNLSPEEIVEYFEKTGTKNRVRPSA